MSPKIRFNLKIAPYAPVSLGQYCFPHRDLQSWAPEGLYPEVGDNQSDPTKTAFPNQAFDAINPAAARIIDFITRSKGKSWFSLALSEVSLWVLDEK
jgi:hypothetical protein